MYIIRYFYQTGDSFSTYDEEGKIEISWADLHFAKQNLKRLEEHYHFYTSDVRDHYRNKKDVGSEYASKDWFVPDHFNCVRLYTEMGMPYQFRCPWCGQFESLKRAKIEDDYMEINFE